MKDKKDIETKSIRDNLAYAYKIVSFLNLDDLTYTHITARSECGKCFYIYPFGLLFDEVTPSCLLKVDFDGNVLEGEEYQYNITGFVTHGSIYKNRSDVNAIFHLHTEDIVAVSAMECGLLPISQWALHFYNKIAYHEYDSLFKGEDSQADKMISDLAEKNVLLLRNHGVITCGKTVHEALFYVYHLEKACRTQCKILSSKVPFVMPKSSVSNKAVGDLLSFEEDLGLRDWKAWIRLCERKEIA